MKLMEILMSKEPSYVRCIKPNDAKQPGTLLHLTAFFLYYRNYSHLNAAFFIYWFI